MKKKKSYYKPKGKKTSKNKTPSKPSKLSGAKKKSYYKPKKKKTTKLAPVVKKKYKSYYKPKEKKVVVSLLLLKPLIEAVKTLDKVENPPIKEAIPSKRPVKYLNNKDLLAQVILSKKNMKMTNELAKMLQLLTMRYGKKGNFANYCVDDQTQALTKRGWLSHDKISLTDEILSYDIKTKNLTWSKIHDKFVSEYDGQMHYLTTQGLDALVTPNHKFVSMENGLKPVEDIICDEHIILNGNPVEDGTNNFTQSEIEFIGWAVTEGHYIKGSKIKHAILLSQKEGVKADKIRQCLFDANIHYIEYTSKVGIVGFHCTGSFVSKVYETYAPTRVLSTEFIVNLTQAQRLLLLDTMILGDGWQRPSGGTSYIQKDKNHVDAVLMLCALSGQTTHTTNRVYRAPPSKIKPEGALSDCYTINIYAQQKTTCKAEWIDFHGGKQGPGGRRKNKPNLPTQQYKGMIWCPKTEYGTFVCRRNGYVYVTGNTYNDDMQSYAMLMIVKTWNGFDPAKSSNPFAWFTQCIKNSFIQYLNYEKRQRDIRDEVLVDSGMLPSYNYQHEYAEEHKPEGPVDNENVELPSKPSHNNVTFEVPEEDDVPVEVLQY